MYTKPIDIANRALQHVGATRIASFLDDDKAAAEIAFTYDKVRRAELRRNIWRFATKRAVLYPINLPLHPSSDPTAPTSPAGTLPTMLLVPRAWSATAVYDAGSIVSYLGQYWTSIIPFNVGQVPGYVTGAETPTAWDIYFGSMCVQPFNTLLGTVPTTPGAPSAYYAGDLVYRLLETGGRYNIFLSLAQQNSLDPMAPTLWSASNPDGSQATFSMGQVVQDAAGWFWQSTIDFNTNNMPGSYDFWSSALTYAAGAYVIGSDFMIYKSIAGGNTNHNPVGGPTYWTATGYNAGSYPIWIGSLTYALNAIVAAVDGLLYQSMVASNTNHNPIGDGGVHWMALNMANPWTSAFITTTGNDQWLNLDASLTDVNLVYPAGAGPSYQTQTRNVFQLPNGYLRVAPQDPKAGSISFLGAPSGIMYTDWEFEGNYFVSRTPYPIVFRFVADVQIVSKFDDMFCEAYAARLGMEVCETITQSADKLTRIGQMYTKAMGDARTANGIETGPTEPAMDDWISCRI